MIRINLLAVERERTKRPRAIIPPAQRVTIGATLILLATALGDWMVVLVAPDDLVRLDSAITRGGRRKRSSCDRSSRRCRSSRPGRPQLQQRVTLIEQLRAVRPVRFTSSTK